MLMTVPRACLLCEKPGSTHFYTLNHFGVTTTLREYREYYYSHFSDRNSRHTVDKYLANIHRARRKRHDGNRPSGCRASSLTPT